MLVNLYLHLFCRIQVAHLVVELMGQAFVFPLKKHLMKLITWETSLDKILMQVDFLNCNMANLTSSIINGELTLVISSIKTRVGHLTCHNNKGLAYMREQQSWKKLLLSLCRCR